MSRVKILFEGDTETMAVGVHVEGTVEESFAMVCAGLAKLQEQDKEIYHKILAVFEAGVAVAPLIDPGWKARKAGDVEGAEIYERQIAEIFMKIAHKHYQTSIGS